MNPEEDIAAILKKFEDDSHKYSKKKELETNIRILTNTYAEVRKNNEDSPELDVTLYQIGCEIRKLQGELHMGAPENLVG